MSDEIHRCIVIGFGYWGPNWAKTIVSNPLTSLVAIVDPSPISQSAALTAYPECFVASTLSDLSGMDFDVAILATPPSTHLELVRQVCLHSVQTIVVEKPISLSTQEAEEMYWIAHEAKVDLVVDYPFLYSGAFEAVGELIKGVGQVENVESQRHNLGIFRPDMNVLWDLAVHDLSIYDAIFGPLQDCEVSATVSNSLGSPHPSTGVLQVRGNNLPQLGISVNWISPVKLRRFVMYSPSGMILWDDTNAVEPVKFYGTSANLERDHLLEYKVGSIYSPIVRSKSALTKLLEGITSERNGFDFEEDKKRSLRITRVLEAADKSASTDSRFMAVV